MTAAWREKTPVLCFYEYVGCDEFRGRTVRIQDSLMIHVEFSDEVQDAFDYAMKRRREKWKPTWVGPRPQEWRLIRYLTPHGTANW